MSQCWDSLFPYYKKSYVKRNTNLKVRDICLLSYKHKLGKDLFRICHVTKIVTGDIDAPRTVEIELPVGGVRAGRLPGTQMMSQVVTIQRLIKLPAWEDDI